MTRFDFFKTYLDFFWLRPETALLSALKSEAVQSTLGDFSDGARTIDVSCGDGIFSFITFGGRLAPAVDAYQSVDLSETYRKGNHDVFDHYDASYKLDIDTFPAKFYEYGTDWKVNLLAKASRLNQYKHLIEHDNNQKMPFEDESLLYVFSNGTYWVEEFEAHLNDLVRITAPKGKIVLEMKTDDIKRFTSAQYIPFMGDTFHEIIDAGRISTWKGLKSKTKLLNILESLDGVRIERFEPMYGDIMCMIWDIGFRPIFNPLTKMAGALEPDMRAKIKKEWCEIFSNLFKDLLMSYKAEEKSAMQFLIVLEKKG